MINLVDFCLLNFVRVSLKFYIFPSTFRFFILASTNGNIIMVIYHYVEKLEANTIKKCLYGVIFYVAFVVYRATFIFHNLINGGT